MGERSKCLNDIMGERSKCLNDINGTEVKVLLIILTYFWLLLVVRLTLSQFGHTM